MVPIKVVKRSGDIVEFDREKIVVAVLKAFIDVDKEETPYAKEKAREIANYVAGLGKDMGVEEIQDVVVAKLMASKRKDVATRYVEHRYKHKLIREVNTTDDTIMELLNGASSYWNEENSNKNPRLTTTQRDYMAGIVSTDITKRVLLPQDIVDAHESGIIHFHDADYFIQYAHNCFSGDTEFITDRGVRKFRSFADGDEVVVVDKDGCLRNATVHLYGKQRMNKVTFHAGRRKKTVICTPNHRWILSDGSVSTSLSVGDKLYRLQDSTRKDFKNLTQREAFAFAIGFVFGDGTDCSDESMRVRLCGDKNKYIDVFERAGFRRQQSIDGDAVMSYNQKNKQRFIDGMVWRMLPANLQALMFDGYYAADGAKSANKICTADHRLCTFIEETSGLAGYYISSSATEVRDTQFKKDSVLYAYHFVTEQPSNMVWVVESIEPYRYEDVNAWCVEEPVTHSFMLAGGMVTGNCDLLNLEDMLQNGTVISGTMIEKPHRFLTACNIATQIIAQVASSQYGGQSISLTHLAPFVDDSRRIIRSQVEQECDDKARVEEIVEQRVREEIRSGIQTIQYQLITLMTTNG